MVLTASSTVASASTAIMSGRGSITSRTTVSPNSKIEWISSRSSVSISASSAATSAIERISCSVTNGPSARPRPGSTMLARPMKPRVSRRSGAKLRDEDEQARHEQHGALGVRDRVGLGRDLGEGEEDGDLEEAADEQADGSVGGLEHRAEERRRHHLAAEQHQQDRVQRAFLMLVSSSTRAARRSPRSASESQLDATRLHERGLGEREDSRTRRTG